VKKKSTGEGECSEKEGELCSEMLSLRYLWSVLVRCSFGSVEELPEKREKQKSSAYDHLDSRVGDTQEEQCRR
jgi:hypothetical protein